MNKYNLHNRFRRSIEVINIFSTLKISVKDYRLQRVYYIHIYTFYQLSYIFIILPDDPSKIGHYSLESEKFKRIEDLVFKMLNPKYIYLFINDICTNLENFPHLSLKTFEL